MTAQDTAYSIHRCVIRGREYQIRVHTHFQGGYFAQSYGLWGSSDRHDTPADAVWWLLNNNNVHPSTRSAITPEPDERAPDDGEQCDSCGCHYQAIYRVPDDVWRQIQPGDSGFGGLLCMECAWRRAKERGITLYYDASPGWWAEDRSEQRLAAQSRGPCPPLPEMGEQS